MINVRSAIIYEFFAFTAIKNMQKICLDNDDTAYRILSAEKRLHKYE